jgi:hypothetical protein
MDDKDKEKDKDKDVPKIMNQFRAKGGMAYDLKYRGARLTLLVSPRATNEDLGDWRVEARASRSPDEAVVLAEWGPTRMAALQALGRSWEANAASQGLAMFDWEGVAAALVAVRAL